MKQLIITIAALVLVGCGESQPTSNAPKAKPIARGVGVKAPDISIHDAARKGNIDVVKQHLAAGTDANAELDYVGTPLHAAAFGGRNEITEFLIAKGADVNAKDSERGSPLHLAASRGHKEIAELLIAEGADVNAKDSGMDGVIPLHFAAYKGHKEIAELLISKGANVNAKSDDGETPLDVTFHRKRTTTADLLRKHGGKTGEELKAEGK